MKHNSSKFTIKNKLFLVLLLLLNLMTCESAFAANDFEIGTTNLHGSEENSANVGDVLLKPEIGWKRYDDYNTNIEYTGSWVLWNNPKTQNTQNFYKQQLHATSVPSEAILKFNFTGSKIRLIGRYDIYSWNSKYVELLIDNIPCSFEVSNGHFTGQAISFMKTDLSEGEHTLSLRLTKRNTDFHFDAIDIDVGGELLPYNEKAIPQKILTFETLEAEQTLNQAFDLKMYMQNITEIAAEDILIKYDPSFLEFNGFKENNAIKVVYSNAANGEIRVVLASMGKDHIINAKTLLSDINFRPIKVGETTVQYTNAKVTDGMTYEKDLLSESLGDILIKIKAPLLLDVNKNGQYTLIDLGIIARNLWATLPNETYNLDQQVDEKVDDLDLIEVFKKVLVNPEYKFGN